MRDRVPDVLTLAEADGLLDPPMPLRTLQARVRAEEAAGVIAHVSTRPAGPRGGRPAREYKASDLFVIHSNWARGTRGRKPGTR